MLRTTILSLSLLSAAGAEAQEAQMALPQVRVNVVNVCTPADAEKAEIAAALARIPQRPVFASDFEIARGRTTEKSGASEWVRLRREFASDPTFSNVQFLLAVNGNGIDETLVFHLKASKPGEPLQIALEAEVTAGTPAQALSADTPPNRIRLERFGKPSLILTRCSDADQHPYEALFRTAAERFAGYRAALNARGTAAAELARLKSTPGTTKKKTN